MDVSSSLFSRGRSMERSIDGGVNECEAREGCGVNSRFAGPSSSVSHRCDVKVDVNVTQEVPPSSSQSHEQMRTYSAPAPVLVSVSKFDSSSSH